ncbi:hypothetical protein [Rhodococcus sp. JVH1]|uniref:hypothetical protein n=1 Tax=Rhodococcus sp. JVH1 TaxID=745408 RepID=UPI0002722234|nr:hypothetical protein [Rhodococcus sp. JVH1]EJI96903.1 hypothetical protein JVH1_5625 [Rhodococcus sp. JVH1]
MSALVSINQAASRLGVAPAEIVDASGLTLGELEHAAEQDGLDACQYRQVPVLSKSDLDVIAQRIQR